MTGEGIVGVSTPWLGIVVGTSWKGCRGRWGFNVGLLCRHRGSRVPSLQELIWLSWVWGLKPPGTTWNPPGTILKTSGGRGKKFPTVQSGWDGSQGRTSLGRLGPPPITFGLLRLHWELKGEMRQTIWEQSAWRCSMRHLSYLLHSGWLGSRLEQGNGCNQRMERPAGLLVVAARIQGARKAGQGGPRACGGGQQPNLRSNRYIPWVPWGRGGLEVGGTTGWNIA